LSCQRRGVVRKLDLRRRGERYMDIYLTSKRGKHFSVYFINEWCGGVDIYVSITNHVWEFHSHFSCLRRHADVSFYVGYKGIHVTFIRWPPLQN